MHIPLLHNHMKEETWVGAFQKVCRDGDWEWDGDGAMKEEEHA